LVLPRKGGVLLPAASPSDRYTLSNTFLQQLLFLGWRTHPANTSSRPHQEGRRVAAMARQLSMRSTNA
jgi:hypothetical protein